MAIKDQRTIQSYVTEPPRWSAIDRGKSIIFNLARSRSGKEGESDKSVGQGKLRDPPNDGKTENKHPSEPIIDERLGQRKLYAPPQALRCANKSFSEIAGESVGQERLYSPLSVETKHKYDVPNGEESEDDEKRTESSPKISVIDGAQGWGVGKVAADLRGSLLQMKDMLMEKLSALSIPADMLEHARQSVESIIREATQTAYGKTRDAMVRIRLGLVEIIPSLTLLESKKIVHDVEHQVLDMSSANGGESSSDNSNHQARHGGSGISVSTASAVSHNEPPPSSVGQIKSSGLFWSRL